MYPIHTYIKSCESITFLKLNFKIFEWWYQKDVIMCILIRLSQIKEEMQWSHFIQDFQSAKSASRIGLLWPWKRSPQVFQAVLLGWSVLLRLSPSVVSCSISSAKNSAWYPPSANEHLSNNWIQKISTTG